MANESIIYQISGFLPRTILWLAVGSTFVAIDYNWFLHRHEVSVVVWLPWTIGLLLIAAGPYFLAYRSACKWIHYLWLGLKFNYGKVR